MAGAFAAPDLTTATGVIAGSLRVPPNIAQPAVVLIVSGSGAVNRNVPAATLLIVEGMSHMLKDATGMTREEQVATVYNDPKIPVVPQVPGAIATLVAA